MLRCQKSVGHGSISAVYRHALIRNAKHLFCRRPCVNLIRTGTSNETLRLLRWSFHARSWPYVGIPHWQARYLPSGLLKMVCVKWTHHVDPSGQLVEAARVSVRFPLLSLFFFSFLKHHAIKYAVAEGFSRTPPLTVYPAEYGVQPSTAHFRRPHSSNTSIIHGGHAELKLMVGYFLGGGGAILQRFFTVSRSARVSGLVRFLDAITVSRIADGSDMTIFFLAYLGERPWLCT